MNSWLSLTPGENKGCYFDFRLPMDSESSCNSLLCKSNFWREMRLPIDLGPGSVLTSGITAGAGATVEIKLIETNFSLEKFLTN